MAEGIDPVSGVTLACPVCRARFRGVRECSRCGTDLEAAMRIAAAAWHAREQCRAALSRGDLATALRWWGRARQLHNVKI